MEHYYDDVTVHIVRGGICMGDNIDEHSLTMSFKRYDCPSVLNLIKMIDLWLIDADNITWEISIGGQALGNIIIDHGVHTYLVLTSLSLTKFDLSKKITCFYKR
jgi:hypothetical protein